MSQHLLILTWLVTWNVFKSQIFNFAVILNLNEDKSWMFLNYPSLHQLHNLFSTKHETLKLLWRVWRNQEGNSRSLTFNLGMVCFLNQKHQCTCNMKQEWRNVKRLHIWACTNISSIQTNSWHQCCNVLFYFSPIWFSFYAIITHGSY